MALKSVSLPPEVYYASILHALTVEKEEVMGLLIGRFDNDGNAKVMSIIVLQRSDKRKDRVEISTEQLHAAMMKTSELSHSLGESINVLGWYHSHPHITVQPSHVDLRTQASYQLMDNRFVGIIFSVFNEDKHMGQEMQVTCFQSICGNSAPYEKLEVPLLIEPIRDISAPCLEAVFQLPSILSEEEIATYSHCQASEILTRFHNDSAFVSSICHILKTIVNPLMLHAENRIKSTHKAIQYLEQEKNAILVALKAQQEVKTQEVCSQV